MTRHPRSSAFSLRSVLHSSAALLCLVIGSLVVAPAQTAPASHRETQHAASLPRSAVHSLQTPGLYDPVADPKAVVRVGNARFTVLTPQLIRMEWTADGKFEDHASFVFLNRHLPVPKFAVSTADGGSTHVIKTDALSLAYTVAPDGNG